MKKQIFSVLSALTAGFALELRAQDVNGDGLVTYLVPISVPQAVHGALGTTWQTELWIHNGADLPVMLGGCGGFVPCLRPYHSPGVTEQASEVGSNLGSMIFDLNASGAGNVTFSSRLFELSRHTQPAGVQMPVVREERFFTRTSRFIGISGSSASRVALRVYDPRRRVGGAVRVEILDENDVVLADNTLSLNYSDSVWEPGYAAIYDIATSFPKIAGIQRFDIRVTPLVAGMEYWALVSVTDQETQQVLLITAD